MKKMMFNDRYGLTQAVIEGRKTMTRRPVRCPRTAKGIEVFGTRACINYKGEVVEIETYDADERSIDGGSIMPPYKVGEIVAVSKKYSSFVKPSDWDATDDLAHTKGWSNKMFVKADLMPHQIRITGVRAERLQDISDEDCLEEGLIEHPYGGYMVDGIVYKGCVDKEYNGSLQIFETPRAAFAALIDKVSGKGTWERNPWVWVYEFELVK